MRVTNLLKIVVIGLLLSGCVAPLLAGAQSQLMWALLKPLVGFDPNEVDLFEQPLIKDRMQPLLGEHYGTAVSLLKTANEIQQEGPLFYVLSNNPVTGPMADKAGFIWNSQTNQMAVLLKEQGKSTVFSEAVTSATDGALSKNVPVWPKEMQSLLDPAALQKQATDKVGAAAQGQLNQAASAAQSSVVSAAQGTVSSAAASAQ